MLQTANCCIRPSRDQTIRSTAVMACLLAKCTVDTRHFTVHNTSRVSHTIRHSGQHCRRFQMATHAAAHHQQMPAEVIVQKQLEAYNARDLETFMDLLSDDCIATDAVTGAVLGSNKAELRKRYQARFQTEVHSELLGRLCLGNVVVDREVISGLPDDQGRTADCLATYHCEGGKIKKMSFVWQPRQQ